MTDIVKRREAGTVGELRVPRWAKQHARAELADMQRRGEIASAFNPREEEMRDASGRKVGVEWVVNYVRLTDPPSKMPRIVAATTVILGAVAGFGAMIYHARYVIAATLLVAALAGIGFLILGLVIESASGKASRHCPGAWHR